MPRKLRVSVEELHGRGLSIVSDMSTRWAVRANRIGETVWSTLALPRGPVLHTAHGHDQR